MKTKKDFVKKSLKSELLILLNDLCVDLGFCLPKFEVEKIVNHKNYEADQFVEDVFIAEGLSIYENLNLTRQVKRKFTDKFGKEVSELDVNFEDK